VVLKVKENYKLIIILLAWQLYLTSTNSVTNHFLGLAIVIGLVSEPVIIIYTSLCKIEKEYIRQ
jgi:hypothetical protein